jgi:hypothetical protein
MHNNHLQNASKYGGVRSAKEGCEHYESIISKNMSMTEAKLIKCCLLLDDERWRLGLYGDKYAYVFC